MVVVVATITQSGSTRVGETSSLVIVPAEAGYGPARVTTATEDHRHDLLTDGPCARGPSAKPRPVDERMTKFCVTRLTVVGIRLQHSAEPRKV